MRLHEIDDKSTGKISRTFEKWFSFTGDYSIDDDGFIFTNGSVQLKKEMTSGSSYKQPIKLSGGKLPVKFRWIDGALICDNCGLSSIEGVPITLGRDISLVSNNITSIKELYDINNSVINGSVNLHSNKLRSLIGLPKFVNGDLSISRNPLQSLEGLPIEVNGTLQFSITDNLPILRVLLVNNITNYNIFPEFVGCKIIEDILHKYKGQGRKGLLNCAAELTKAGFKGNARL